MAARRHKPAPMRETLIPLGGLRRPGTYDLVQQLVTLVTHKIGSSDIALKADFAK